MALQEFPNMMGLPIIPLPGYPEATLAPSASIMDAVGESVTFIGKLYLSTGTGTSKTISSAGGKIYWLPTGTITFSNASTNVRVGIQDVTATTGIEDGTFDVYDDLVGGTDTITSGTIHTVTMSSGTKTISHGDIIAISLEMTARGGTDVVRVARGGSSTFPYMTADTGSGPAKLALLPIVLVEFDDGTLGTLGFESLPYEPDNISYSSSSTPDEYALLFQIPFKASTNYLVAFIGDQDSGDEGELILYSDPLGTPVAERTVSIDADIQGITTAGVGIALYNITEYTLSPNTTYAVAYRPTTTGSRLLGRVTIPTANSRGVFPLGTTMSQGTRTDNSGAFSSSSTTIMPLLGCYLNKLDDGVQTGGSGGFFIQ